MKLPFPIADFRFPIADCPANCKSQIANRKCEGVALIITLILLSVTLVMALAFLAISRRENSSVATQTDTATARLAADAALAAAEAQVSANILSTTNPYNFGLLVSTNYINYAGFVSGLANPTNVNYDHLFNSPTPLAPGDFLQNLANLYYAPRPPVFIPTNGVTSGYDFRYYLDLNRNGRFDTNGFVANLDNNNISLGPDVFEVGDPEWIGVLEHPDQPYGPNNLFIARFAFIALPAGNALDLNAIYNDAAGIRDNLAMTPANDGYMRNQGVGSWELNLAAFLTDLNTNQWDTLADPYNYRETMLVPQSNAGRGFEDALSLLSYRYGYNYNTQASANNSLYFPDIANYPTNIDLYSDGPLQITTDTNEAYQLGLPTAADVRTLPWSGADNTNRFFALPSELFDPTKSSGGAVSGFTNSLLAAGNGIATYDRYTFYRMLAQLGTDTAPDSGKMNLNYDNLDPYAQVVKKSAFTNQPSATNLVSWTPLGFFTNAADRMLRLYTTNWFQANPTDYLATYYGIPFTTLTNPFFFPSGISANGYGLTNFPLFGMTNQVPAFGITNIPVWINTNFVYSPAVNRVLQLAANLYDATTTNFYPDVFRPIFEHDFYGNVYIVGYTNLNSINGPNTVSLPNDFTGQLQNPLDVSALSFMGPVFSPILSITNNGPVNVYGVPWIIGAKKYLPAFNQESMVNAARFERRLQVARNSVGGQIWTNQAVSLTVDNDQGVSFWNSYANDYPTNYPGNLHLGVYVLDTVQMVLSNSDWGPGLMNSTLFTTNFAFFPTRWPGSYWGANGGGAPAANSFLQNYWTNNFVPESVYNFTTKMFNQTMALENLYDTNRHILDPLPQFELLTTNWLQAYIVDNTHLIDYVQLRGPIDSANLTNALSDPNYRDETGINYLWSINTYGSGKKPPLWPSWGIVNQIDISSIDETPPPFAQWKNPGVAIPGLSDPTKASRVFFGSILSPNSSYQYQDDLGRTRVYFNNELAVQAPYTAMRTIFVPYLYQVNDPLVHDLASDLDTGPAGDWSGNNVRANGVWIHSDDMTAPLPQPPSVDIVNGRYQPWSRTAPQAYQGLNYNFTNAYNLIYKDPLVWSPDFWDFPTNRYPTVGWIGRVHRGTPWQTVYLKAQNVLHVFGPGVPPNNASGTNTWSAWTGDLNNNYDAANSAPIQDRLLFDVFTAAPNDNATRGQLSVNQTNLAAWSAAFSGMVAITNTAVWPVSSSRFPYAGSYPTTNSWLVIPPAGVNGLNSVMGDLVTNINNQRLGFTNADGLVGEFEHKGDILSVRALTEQSPFLNLNDTRQPQYGISDEAYEWLPQQMMSLLTVGSPRYVIYAYGQGLKPAANGTYLAATPAGMFGMVTNYQVVSEMAVRAVVRLDTARTNLNDGSVNVTPPRAVIESFNVLPPN